MAVFPACEHGKDGEHAFCSLKGDEELKTREILQKVVFR